MRNRKPLRLVALFLAAAAVALPGLFAACEAQTAGRHIVFEAAFRGGTTSTAAPSSFITSEGWSVTLSEARAVVGPVYFYGGEARETLVQRLFGIRAARACPTHAQFDNGPVLGEVLAQHVVDLLAASAQSLGLVQGIAGTVEAAELHLHPPGTLPAGSPADSFTPLGGEGFAFIGSATKEDLVVPFVARLTIPDSGLMRIVESIPASVELVGAASGPGAITVEALVDRWFDAVRFDTLTERDADDRFLFSSGTQATNALLQGLRMRDAYRITWSTP